MHNGALHLDECLSQSGGIDYEQNDYDTAVRHGNKDSALFLSDILLHFQIYTD